MYTCHGNDALHPTHRLSDLPIEINGAAAQTKRLTCRCGVVTQCKIAIQQFKKKKSKKHKKQISGGTTASRCFTAH